MAKVELTLPDELVAQLNARGVSASELLEAAVRTELERQAPPEETGRYLAELTSEVGEPSRRELDRADAVAHRVRDNAMRHASQ